MWYVVKSRKGIQVVGPVDHAPRRGDKVLEIVETDVEARERLAHWEAQRVARRDLFLVLGLIGILIATLWLPEY